jgi:hypothetical protein
MAEKKKQQQTDSDQDRNKRNSSEDNDRSGKGTPPKTANEGGVTEEGTGDFAPDASGSKLTVEIGADGTNPVSPQNPPRKAMLGGGDAETNPDATYRNEGAEITEDLKDPDTAGPKGGDVEVTKTD